MTKTLAFRLLIVAILVYLSGAILQLWFFGVPESRRYGGGVTYSPFMQLFSYAMYFSAVALIVSGWRHMAHAWRRSKALWLMVAYIGLSALWALDGAASFDEWKVMLLGFLFGVYVSRIDAPHQLQILGLFYGAVVLAGLFFAVRYPYLGTYMGADGSWRGAFGDRNEMAMHSNIALVCFMTAWVAAKTKWIRYLLLAPLIMGCGLLIVKSNSATGLICMITLMLLSMVLPLLRKNTALLLGVGVPILALAALTMGAIFSNSDTVLKLLGKDPTLTGRTHIWEEFLDAAAKEPLFGYGAQKVYVRSGSVLTRSFYDAGAGESYAYAAHNMYLSMLLKYGAVGMLIFALAIVQMARAALRANRNTQDPMSRFYILLLSVVLLFGMSLTIDNMGIIWCYMAMIANAASRGSSGAPLEASEDPLPVTSSRSVV